MEYFNSIPLEIAVNILTRLPTDSVLQCKSVCRTWLNLISHHPLFCKLHLRHLYHPSDSAIDCRKLGFLTLTPKIENEIFHYFEYDESTDSTPIEKIRRISITPPFKSSSFVNSCNGLICLLDYNYPSVWIGNPITRECVMLPEIETVYCDMDDVYWTIGFGYVSSTDEYKVVGIYVLEPHLVAVHVYTLGSGNGWRDIGNFNSQFREYSWERCVFANETLYWLDNKVEMVLTFDLALEKFCENLSPPPLPPCIVDYITGWNFVDWNVIRIGVLDGFLYFAHRQSVEEGECFDTWLLKKNNGDHGLKERGEHQSLGWSKEFRVDKCEILAVTKSGGVLTCMDNYLNIYDTKASTSTRLVEFKEQFRIVIPHKNTLVSLKELGEEDTKTMESVEGDRKS